MHKEKKKTTTTRHIVCPVRNSSRVHLYHVALSTTSLIRPYLEKLNLYASFILG